MLKSLRGRLLGRLILGVGVLLAVGGYFLVRAVEARARRDFDRALEDRVRALSSLAEQEGDRVWFEFDPAAFPEFFPGASANYFEFRNAEGETLLLSPSNAGRKLPLRDLEKGEGSPRFVDLELFDGRAGRAAVYRFDPRVEDEEPASVAAAAASPFRVTPASDGGSLRTATLLVARERVSLDRFVGRVRSAVLVFSAFLLLTLSAVIVWVVDGELGPVKLLTARLSEVDAGTLGTPIGELPLPSELRPIALRVDELLSRLHVSFERERAFSSQLAHELRTPLAELRSTVEVALRFREGDQQLVESLAEAGQIGVQMERLLKNLLALARADAGIEPLRATPAQLAPAVKQALVASAPTFEARRVECRNLVDSQITVVAPAAALELILSNLAANAAEYAPGGGWVEVSFDSERSTLSFSNPCADLSAADLERLFERFWRKSSGREVGEHAGLGLPLVRALARRIGGDANAYLRDEVLEIRVTGLAVVRSSPPHQSVGA